MREITVSASGESIDVITELANEELAEHSCPFVIQAKIDIVIDEICSNINNYAYDDKSGEITFSIDVADSTAILVFSDSGRQFDPTVTDDPDVTIPVSKKKIGGLDIFMTKKIMDSVEYAYENGRNIRTLKKCIAEG